MKKTTYNLEGISAKNVSNAESRNEIVLAVVKQNPKIQHSRLKDAICNKIGAMAGKTFDSVIAELRNKGVLIYEKEKNRIYYSTPKEISSQDLSFLKIIDGEIFHINKVLQKGTPFTGLHPGMQITLAITLAEHLAYLESAYLTASPLYENSHIKKMDKKFRQSWSAIRKMHRSIDSSHVRLLQMQLVGYASVKKIEIEKIVGFVPNVRVRMSS